MCSLFVFDDVGYTGGQFFDDFDSLLVGANGEKLLHHVIGILIDNQFAKFFLQVFNDDLYLLFGNFFKVFLEQSRLHIIPHIRRQLAI